MLSVERLRLVEHEYEAILSGVVDVSANAASVLGFNEVDLITGSTAPKRASIIIGKAAAASFNVMVVAHKCDLLALLLPLTGVPEHDIFSSRISADKIAQDQIPQLSVCHLRGVDGVAHDLLPGVCLRFTAKRQSMPSPGRALVSVAVNHTLPPCEMKVRASYVSPSVHVPR